MPQLRAFRQRRARVFIRWGESGGTSYATVQEEGTKVFNKWEILPATDPRGRRSVSDG